MRSDALQSDYADVAEMIEMAENLLLAQKQFIHDNQSWFDENRQTIQDVIELRLPMQEGIKSDLEALQKEFGSSGKTTGGGNKLEHMMKEEGQMRKEGQNNAEKQKEMSELDKRLEKHAAELLVEKENLLEEKERRENQTTVVLPLRREEITLFNYISGIKWDFEGLDDNLEGYITNKTEVKTFSFEKDSSIFDVTNSLWDLMSED